MLLAIFVFEVYLALPPGIPYVTKRPLVPIRFRIANYVIIGLVAFILSTYGFTFAESLALGFIWMTVGAYIVLDYLYGVPLAS